MFKEVSTQRLFVSVVVWSLLSLAACGGGTTGTSSTDTVKFSGFAEQSNGGRAPFLSMTVRSGLTNEDLEKSGTDSKGDFSMSLPASEQSLIVDVSGVGITTMQRQQQGSGLLSAKLSATKQGTLVARQQFEVQIDQATLCTQLASEGTELLVLGSAPDAPCPVTLIVGSETLSARLFRGSVVASCDNRSVVVSTTVASESGVLALDLQEAFLRDCSDIQLVVTNAQAAQLRATIPVR